MTTSEILMTIFTAVIATTGVIGAVIFNNQLSVMQGQLDQMKSTSKIADETLITTQRPWVSVKATIGPRGLFYDANGANLDLIFLLKNTGNTPAVTVRIEGSPRIDVKTNDRIIELEKICAAAKSQESNPKMVGYTIFPGDTLPINVIYSFADKETLERTANAEHGFILPIVIGCVDYFLTFGEPVHHQSRFVYTVDYPIPEGGSACYKHRRWR
jgi:hypothetical protein